MTRTRTLLLAAVISLSLVAGFAAPTLADDKDDIKREQRQNRQKLQDARDDVAASAKTALAAKQALSAASTKLTAAQNALGQTRGRLAVAQAEDARLRAELDRAEAQLAAAQQRLKTAERHLKSSRAVVASFAVDQVLSGDTGLKAFGDLLRGADPEDFSEQMSMNTSVGDAQVAVMQQLAASEVMLGVQRDEVEDLRDKVAVQHEQAEAVVATMQALTAQAEAQAASVAHLVTSRAAAKKQADDTLAEDQARQAAFEAEGRQLEARMAAVVAAELAAARARERAKNKNKGGSSSLNEDDAPTGDSGGALSRPVSGPITSPYGMRVHPVTGVYKLHDGTDFGVACGTPVRAAASGTIIEQYYNGAYGNRVILNNGVKRGVSVITTYNHLSRFKLRTGARVERGQVIAYSGTTGYSTGCHLHFMVLVNGRTTNPMNWL